MQILIQTQMQRTECCGSGFYRALMNHLVDKIQKSSQETFIIVVDGLIGAGKSTTIQLIKQDLGQIIPEVNVKCVEENVDTEGKELLKLYLDQPFQYSMMFQTWIVSNKMKQFENTIDKLSGKTVVLVDRHIKSDIEIFATMCHKNGYLTNDQKIEYDKFVSQLTNHSKIMKPDICVYVKIPASVALERIKKRNRQGEENYTIDYIQKLEKMYDELYLQGAYIFNNE
jgi:deoxyadenosine/deoxycytidine kinase